MKNKRLFFGHRGIGLMVFIFLATGFIGADSFAATGFTIQGRILDVSGNPITSPSVIFRLQLRSSGTENCLLFQETHTLDLSETGGAFSLSVGSGTRASATIDGGLALASVLSNSQPLSLSAATSPCAAGTTYTPALSDDRKIEISFDDGNGWDSLPSLKMSWLPQSVYSQDAGKLGGTNASQFISVAGGTTVSPLTASEYTELLSLIDGSSSHFGGGGGGSGSVTSVATGTGLTGGPITTTGSISLANTAVTAGSYGSSTLIPSITIDAQGRITSASNNSIPNANGSTTGVLSSTDWTTFNSKLSAINGSSLDSGKIWVGNGINQAAAITPSSDLSLSNAGAFTVLQIRGRTISSAAPSLGAYFKWNHTLSQWESSYFGTCNGVSEVLHYSSVTDLWNCDTVSVSSATGTLPVANGGTGQTTPEGAVNAILPSQTSHSGKFLTTDGSNVSWASLVAWNSGASSSINYTAGNVGIGTAQATSKLTLGGQESWTSGLGAITHLQGPTDQTFTISAASPTQTAASVVGNNLNLAASNATAGSSTNGAAGGGSVNITAGNAMRLTSGDASGGNINLTTGSPIGGFGYGSINLNLGTGNPGALNVNRHKTNTYSSSSISTVGPNATVVIANDFYADNNSSILSLQVRNGSQTQRGYLGVISTTGAGVYNPSMVFGIQTGANSYSEQMRLDSSGNIGIGTPTPTYKLDVNGDLNIASASAIRFGGTQVCTTSGCTSTSDGRLKTNILPLNQSLSNILKLQGMSYEWKDKEHFGDRPQIGLIAQEVEKIYPEVVITDRRTGLKSMAYDHLVAPIIESLKELFIQLQTMNVQNVERDQSLRTQDLRLKRLEEENAMLKNRLETLEQVLKNQ